MLHGIADCCWVPRHTSRNVVHSPPPPPSPAPSLQVHAYAHQWQCPVSHGCSLAAGPVVGSTQVWIQPAFRFGHLECAQSFRESSAERVAIEGEGGWDCRVACTLHPPSRHSVSTTCPKLGRTWPITTSAWSMSLHMWMPNDSCMLPIMGILARVSWCTFPAACATMQPLQRRLKLAHLKQRWQLCCLQKLGRAWSQP